MRRGFHPTHQPLRATPPLGLATYDFPLYGDISWGDTYGAGRSDVPGGWHHGDDLFAKLGTPVVAVADGTVFAVGWNRVGGWRLWLRDELGNAFYYAHLAGYTALSKDNHHVSRGEVLGFVGNTGDAHTTDPHLHFEVHPNTLLYLGYDGAVDPTTYLAGWHRPATVRDPAARRAAVARARRARARWPTTAASWRSGRWPAGHSCRSWSPSRRYRVAVGSLAPVQSRSEGPAPAGRGGSVAAARGGRRRPHGLERTGFLICGRSPSSSAASEPTRSRTSVGR